MSILSDVRAAVGSNVRIHYDLPDDQVTRFGYPAYRVRGRLIGVARDHRDEPVAVIRPGDPARALRSIPVALITRIETVSPSRHGFVENVA